MYSLVKILARSRLLKGDLDLHLVRGSMVLIFLLFGYQKWFEYEAQTLVPFIRNGPLTFWMYPAFGLHGASYFLGVSEWLTAALLIWGYWNPRAGLLGALLSVATFVTTMTIIPFMPNGWNEAAGFPSMQGNVAFLMKDTAGIGLDAAGVRLDERGYVQLNDRLETRAPNVWAIGECAGSPQFTQVSEDANDGGDTRLYEGAHRRAVRPHSGLYDVRRGGGEVMAVVQTAMLAGMPYTGLRDAILAHPTMAEGLRSLFSEVPPSPAA